MSRADRIQALWRGRPRSRFARLSGWVAVALVAAAWSSGEIALGDLFTARRRANLEHFLTHESIPRPLRGRDFDGGTLTEWLAELLAHRGLHASLATLAIAVLAIALAGAFAALAAPWATRTLAKPEPYVHAARQRPIASALWSALRGVLRSVFVLMRAIPEYVWAFLLLAALGPNAWPAVLALAVHNAGILGRLGSETLENLDARPLTALRALGASRAQISWAALRPLAFPRALIYFFYRFESCVREATVLGMLGVASLGYWIQDARTRGRYDELLVFVALGSLLILIADATSQVVRRALERSS